MSVISGRLGVNTIDLQIAKVTHYYDKLGVAIVEVINQPLKIGDKIKLSGHDNEFTQIVESLQIEHNKVPEVSKGETAGLKVDQPVKAGDIVYLVEQ